MKINTILIAVFACSIVVALAACGDKKPAEKKAQPQAAAPQAAASSASAALQDEVKAEKEIYAYDPKGRRDPFVPLNEIVKEKTLKKRGSRPIENVDVEEIKVIAIAWDSQQFYAMVTLPDKKSYTIRKGMTLGLYGGRVREITKDSVIITEQIKDYKGQLKTKDTILKLRKEEEE
jgi:type IV pilus assembly protein PilP